MVQAGNDWLKSIAQSMKDAIANGAAPTPVPLTVREFMRRFGYERRGDWINSRIRHALDENDLSMDQDFAIVSLDSTIFIRLDSDAHDVAAGTSGTPDPTNRIGSLGAANKKPRSVKPEEPLRAATTIMLLDNYSQLPVMTKVGKVLGIVSWESIGARLSLGQKCEFVQQCMDTAEILEDKKPILEAMVAEHGYVLVSDRDDAIVGIVTASDLSLQFMQLAEPFLRIGEIEGHLRNLIRGKFTVDQLKAASDPEERRPIRGAADLTLGGYGQLLGNRANWELLGLNIDRKEFCST